MFDFDHELTVETDIKFNMN